MNAKGTSPRAIVTVMRRGDLRAWDVEVPTDIPAHRLVQMIVQAMGWEKTPAGTPVSYRLRLQPTERELQPRESLAAAAVWDGAWLVLDPVT